MSRPFPFTLLGALLLLTALAVDAAPAPVELRLASWNLEWLLDPASARELRNRCRTGPQPHLPCDVVLGEPRARADLRAIARVAARLGADVIALQEVEGPAVAARLFPGYRFCFTARRDWQNVGFAVRADLPHRCDGDVVALSLGDRVRRGAALTLFPDAPRPLALLAIHLKSGCSRGALDAGAGGRRECAMLARQAPALAAWMDAQDAAGVGWAVLGDFNRDLRRDGPHAGLAGAIAALRTPGAEAPRDASAGTDFVPCHSGQAFTGYIDYVLLGGTLAPLPARFGRVPFADDEARRFRLPDHCPVVVTLRLRTEIFGVKSSGDPLHADDGIIASQSKSQDFSGQAEAGAASSWKGAYIPVTGPAPSSTSSFRADSGGSARPSTSAPPACSSAPLASACARASASNSPSPSTWAP